MSVPAGPAPLPHPDDAGSDRPALGVARSDRMSSERIFKDSTGLEWEVYDESHWNAALALAWDHPPQRDNPGLLFISSRDLRRLWPAPPGWETLTDEELEKLCARAASLT
jgi:hypothetical protein